MLALFRAAGRRAARRRPWSSVATKPASPAQPLPPPPSPPSTTTTLHPSDVLTPLATAALVGFSCLVAADVARADALDRRAANAFDYLARVGAAMLGSDQNPDTPSWALNLPEPLRQWATDAAVEWDKAPSADRAVAGIAAANLAVWAARRVPPTALSARLWDAVFPHALPPARPRPLTLTLSNWAHVGGLHLLANMAALAAIGPRAAEEMGAAHFVGAYAACGLGSAAASHIGRAVVAGTRGGGGASVGASGCVYGILAWLATTHPADAVRVFPLDSPVRLADAVTVMVAADVVGAVARFRLFDHWGHLGGAAAGFALAKAGDMPWDAAAAAAVRVRAARDAADAWLDEMWRSGGVVEGKGGKKAK